MQVAVVDDDAGVRGALGRLLRVSGFRVETFASAEEFLQSGRSTELDCLVVDVYLGGMSGSDLRAELTAVEGQAPPTVLVTAHDDAAITAMLRRSEDVICLRKPFDESSLLFAIDCVTGRLDQAGAG